MKTKYQRFLEKAALFRAKVYLLHEQGEKQIDIAKKTGVTRARISQILRERQCKDSGNLTGKPCLNVKAEGATIASVS